MLENHPAEDAGRPSFLYRRSPSVPMYSMVYMTVGSEEEAAIIVGRLVEAGLVACGNIFRIRSIYRWKERTQDEPEAAVIMKTRTSLVEKVREEIRGLHSYEVPCIASYSMESGLPEYLAWVDEVTSPA